MSDIPSNTTWRIADCLGRLEADGGARSELIDHAHRRLRLLAERMFAGFVRLHDREQVEDVCQEGIFRLWRALDDQRPASTTEFMGLAALQMRRTLGDLARTHFGRSRSANDEAIRRPVLQAGCEQHIEHAVDGNCSPPDVLSCWAEFHAAADQLPEPERTVFDLLYYHEISQNEVAELLNVSDRQVRRYWQSARRSLLVRLEEVLPGDHRLSQAGLYGSIDGNSGS